METQQNQDVPEELRGIVDEADGEEAPEKVIRAKLRPGYTFKVGDKVLYGPRIVSVDADTARENMHKFDNTAEIRDAIGLPPIPKRLTLAEEQEIRMKATAELTAEAMSRVNGEIIEKSVQAALTTAFAELDKRGMLFREKKAPEKKAPAKGPKASKK